MKVSLGWQEAQLQCETWFILCVIFEVENGLQLVVLFANMKVSLGWQEVQLQWETWFIKHMCSI